MSKFAELESEFARDADKEKEGVWMTFGSFQYRIAAAHRNNTAFSKMMEEEMRPYQWALARDNVEALKGAGFEAMQRVYAKTVLKEIRRADTKEVLETSWEERVDLFKRLPDLWDTVFAFSKAATNYRPEAIEDDAKN